MRRASGVAPRSAGRWARSESSDELSSRTSAAQLLNLEAALADDERRLFEAARDGKLLTGTNHFGRVHIDFGGAAPSLTASVIDENSAQRYSVAVALSDLTFANADAAAEPPAPPSPPPPLP